MEPQPKDLKLSVVIPVFNDEEVLPELHRRLDAALRSITQNSEIIYVDDGSSDGSLRVLMDLRAADDSITIVQLDGNFGQPNAIEAGLELATGDYIVIMDSDLQDRPEDIAALIDALLTQKVPMSIATSSQRQDQRWKILVSKGFNALANKMTSIRSPLGARVFRVLKRELIDVLKQHPERRGSALSFLLWLGYRYAAVELPREARYAGSSGYTFRRMLNLGLDRILKYSTIPFRLIARLGLILGAIGLWGVWYLMIVHILPTVNPSGWVIFFVILLFALSLLVVCLGILSALLDRLQSRMKHKIRYIVSHIYQKVFQVL
ncbi:MAG: glycosyltransferase family 2 protein [bacterium]|nr:glycosyltransferase family 2 protein [bacterium]